MGGCSLTGRDAGATWIRRHIFLQFNALEDGRGEERCDEAISREPLASVPGGLLRYRSQRPKLESGEGFFVLVSANRSIPIPTPAFPPRGEGVREEGDTMGAPKSRSIPRSGSG